MTNLTMLVRDRLTLTQQAISSLATSGARDMTLTILDDRSVQPTREWLAHIPTFAPEVHVVRNETPMGTGPLRNLAVKASEEHFGRGDYLYLSDNDVAFKDGWLQTLIQCYDVAYPSFLAIGAYNHPFHQPVSRWGVGNYTVDEVNALASQSMLMRWQVWYKFGPFCETPVDKVCQSEDHAFCQKIREAGFKVGVVSPALIVNCGITNSFGEHIPGYEQVKAQCPRGVICE